MIENFSGVALVLGREDTRPSPSVTESSARETFRVRNFRGVSASSVACRVSHRPLSSNNFYSGPPETESIRRSKKKWATCAPSREGGRGRSVAADNPHSSPTDRIGIVTELCARTAAVAAAATAVAALDPCDGRKRL